MNIEELPSRTQIQRKSVEIMAGNPSPAEASASTAAVQSPSLKLPFKTKMLMAVLCATTDAATRSNGTVNRSLVRILSPPVRASSKPEGGARSVDVTVDQSRGLWFRLFVPVNASPAAGPIPVIVFFHGGGFILLSAASHGYDAVCRRICSKTGAIVASVEYRLAPEHRHPACYDDGEEVLRFLDSGGLDAADAAASGMADLSSCFLAGDSAGGNIAHNVARRWAAASTSWNRVKLAGLMVIQPYFGGEERTASEVRLAKGPLLTAERTDWSWRAFLPEGANRDHEAANVFGPRGPAELEEGFPRAAVVIGGFDPLQDRQRRYCEGLKERGKEVETWEYPSSIHAFYVFPELKEAGELIEKMKDYVEKYKSK